MNEDSDEAKKDTTLEMSVALPARRRGAAVAWTLALER